jgi:mono/diheme cytochrome c family protein
MRILIAISLLFTLVACSPNNPIKMSMIANPLPNTLEVAAAGKAIFETHCQVCHGIEGRGDGIAASSLTSKPANLRLLNNKPEGLIAMRIIGGGNVMPAWKNILTQEEIWQLTRHIKTISQQEAQNNSR